MKEKNYVKWLQLTTTQPNVFAIFLRKLFDADLECECRNNGEMYIHGNINSCISCVNVICTLDTHLYLGVMPTALIGWFFVLLEGMLLSAI